MYEKNEIDTHDEFVRDEREQCVLHLFLVKTNGGLILFILFLSENNWNVAELCFRKLIGTSGEIILLDFEPATMYYGRIMRINDFFFKFVQSEPPAMFEQ